MTAILAMSGSLRAASTNSALIAASQALAPADVTVRIYTGLARLPAFNPDRDSAQEPAVRDLLAEAEAADGLLIACPEYARGIPGAFKNALDWLVGSTNFAGKPVALWNASPRAGDAQAALALVLTTMALPIIEAASLSLPLLGTHLSGAEIAADPMMADEIRRALGAFAAAIASTGA